MPRSLELLEDLIGNGKLRVKANPALTFAASSAVHSPDPKGNLIYDKRASNGRIDGLVALAMAVGAVMGEAADSGSIYDDPIAYAEAFGRMPKAERTGPHDDGETWSPEIIADVRHPLFAEHKRRFEVWQDRNADRDWDC